MVTSASRGGGGLLEHPEEVLGQFPGGCWGTRPWDSSQSIPEHSTDREASPLGFISFTFLLALRALGHTRRHPQTPSGHAGQQQRAAHLSQVPGRVGHPCHGLRGMLELGATQRAEQTQQWLRGAGALPEGPLRAGTGVPWGDLSRARVGQNGARPGPSPCTDRD